MRKNRFISLLILSFLLLVFTTPVVAQSGCTDIQATNYDPTAVVNDGSCLYPVTTLSTTFIAPLQTPLLDENSGLFRCGDNYWTHVDDTYEELHALDTNTGNISRTVTLSGASNIDWEEAQADSHYVYVGDIGNNSGTRTDLVIYRYPISVLDSGAVAVLPDTIRFSYSDQTDFTASLNNTRFDCEAFVVLNDTLHLFSKDWVLKNTRHYTLPAIPGNHVAQLQDSLSANGLITGASISSTGVLVLLGYDNQIPAPCFMWMFYDYRSGDFFSGNKRRFSLGTALTLGQTEAIAFRYGNQGYISNERFQQSIFNVAPQLRSFSLDSYITPPVSRQEELVNSIDYLIYPQPATTGFYVKSTLVGKTEYRLLDSQGRTIQVEEGQGGLYYFELRNVASGCYTLAIRTNNGVRSFRQVFFQ